ncbi:S53 family peptidase [Duganella vulcania]|uniref:Peptidase S53 n=1 Tax=Duganella vulcania TaxID=2692166 RepID=A0A845GQC1_9BURK|nr:S53 family peptidase [Duganella vulcania]MYM95466.1 peptidase S53 [Duganella vulcania]
MMKNQHLTKFNASALALPALALCTAAMLSACGGGGADNAAEAPVVLHAAPLATGSTTLVLDPGTLPAEDAQRMAQPSFHMAPIELAAPDDHADSATAPVHAQAVPTEFRHLSTRRLTMQALQGRQMEAPRGQSQQAVAAPAATASVVATYTPAQVRAAYGLPTLPAAGSALTAAQAAQLGAGQTIYILDAQHDPNVAAELAAFNTKFSLPACTTKSIAPTAGLPLAAASTGGCELAVVYSTASGAMTSTQPAYDAGWASEIALDVQWAHATAPLARIVLIETADASYNNLLGGAKLAKAMGPGIVSMSFGGAESSGTTSSDSVFAAPGMTYLAATGDSGAGVSWPAVAPHVLAVGGTTLHYSGSGLRSEVAWSGTGGGVSLYTATPSYQTNAVPGMGTPARRTVADVAFNADPSSGQYVAMIAPGSGTVRWGSVGGTSLSTPQWAGLIAVANATRALNGKAALGAPHAALYGGIAAVPGTYASAFADITAGSDGSCAACTAKTGYDQLTGLGTPNVSSLLSTLSGLTIAAAPQVGSASIQGTVGTALTFTVSTVAANPVGYALTGAPSGMSITSAGVVGWAAPVAGTYAVTVTAKDSKTGLSGQGVYTVVIAPLSAPVLTSGTISGKVGVALSFSAAASSANPVTYALSGAPSGMTISTAGLVSWAKPVAGVYTVIVTARDSKTGLSGQAKYTVQLTNGGPVITAAAMTGVAGKPMTGLITVVDNGASSVSITISGVPLGMMFQSSGLSVMPYWSAPVAGSYQLKVVVTDNAGGSAQLTIPVTVASR